MRSRLTARLVEGAELRDVVYLIWDSQVPGLAARIYPSGVRTFVFLYRAGRAQRQVTLGDVREMNLAAARKQAAALKLGVRGGADPKAERDEARHAETMDVLVERYLSEKSHLRQAAEMRQRGAIVRKRLRPPQRVRDVTARDIRGLLSPYRERRAYVASNRLRSFVAAVFNFAEREKLRPRGSNPCADVPKWKEQPRTRILAPHELALLHRALLDVAADARRDRAHGATRLDAVSYIRLLLLLGCRKSELLLADWSWVSWDEQLLTIPAEFAKSARSIEKPLPEAALEILEELRPKTHGPIFPSPQDPTRSRTGVRKTWLHVRARAGLTDVRLHDLRRTAASEGAAAGVPIFHVSKLLGHSTTAETERVYLQTQRAGLRAAAETISRGLTEKLTAKVNVIPLRAGRR